MIPHDQRLATGHKLGASCWGFTRQPESPNEHIYRSWPSKTPKFHEKTPRKRQKERKWWRGEIKKNKREILDPPPLERLLPLGLTLRAPPFGPPPFGPRFFWVRPPPTLRGHPPFGARRGPTRRAPTPSGPHRPGQPRHSDLTASAQTTPNRTASDRPDLKVIFQNFRSVFKNRILKFLK